MQDRLPDPRQALTLPFHPYLPWQEVSFLWHCLCVTAPGISPASRPVEPGLSSPEGATARLTLLFP